MTATKRIKRALVSVYHKDGLDEILRSLMRKVFLLFLPEERKLL